MRRCIPICLVFVVAGAGLVSSSRGDEPAAKKQSPAPRAHALLVGCTTYDHLPKNRQLRGPANDVRLFKQVLIEKFHCAPEQMTTLIEEMGGDARPVRKNIEREFKRLAEVARTGDRVVILLAGHGSRQPNDPRDVDDLEADGMDEVFCPADVNRLSAETGTIQNAIVDDELGVWLRAITDRGAAVWIIADCCHSGTLTRFGEVKRGFDSADLLPPDARAKARRRPAAVQRGDTRDSTAWETPAATKGNLVSLAAAQPHEDAPEDDFGGVWHGLLTHSLCQVLTRAERPVTYRELQQRIYACYRQRESYPPTPLLEGHAMGASDTRDQQVLGEATVAHTRRSLLVKAVGQGRWQVNAGGLHDLTVGSVLAVYSGQATAVERIGHVRITQVSPLEAVAEACAFENHALRSDFPAENRCELVFLDCGLHRLKLAVDPLAEKTKPTGQSAATPLPDESVASLRAGLRTLADREKFAAVVDDWRQADWLVRFRDGEPYLVHRSAESDDRSRAGKRFGPFPKDDRLVHSLETCVRRLARADNLLRLAAVEREDASGSRQTLQVELELRRYPDKSLRGGQVVAWERGGLRLMAGEYVGFRVTNNSPMPVDVCLLFVDSRFGITQYFPQPGEANNRLLRGETITLRSGRITADSLGLENLVLVAIPGKPLQPPLDLACLQQAHCLVSERSSGEAATLRPKTDSPLEQFLLRSRVNLDTERGFARGTIAAHVMRLYSWETVAK